MAGFTYATLTTAIQNYTEVDTNVLTSTITDQFIENAEMRILRDIPLDAFKKQSTGNLVTGQTTINVPAKTLFVKGVQVYTSTSVATGANTWLEKKRRILFTRIYSCRNFYRYAKILCYVWRSNRCNRYNVWKTIFISCS
jgi:hypothetical protein